jgi:Rod binding domain-containing protein
MTDLSSLLPSAHQADALAARLEFAGEKDSSVADEFEGMFMSLVVKEMRKATPEGGLFAGDASDAYGGMFDLFMGQHLARCGGGIGIRQMVNTYLANAKLHNE